MLAIVVGTLVCSVFVRPLHRSSKVNVARQFFSAPNFNVTKHSNFSNHFGKGVDPPEGSAHAETHLQKEPMRLHMVPFWAKNINKFSSVIGLDTATEKKHGKLKDKSYVQIQAPVSRRLKRLSLGT